MHPKTVRRNAIRIKYTIPILGAMFFSNLELITERPVFLGNLPKTNSAHKISLDRKGKSLKNEFLKGKTHGGGSSNSGIVNNFRKYTTERIECKYVPYSPLPVVANEKECKVPLDKRLPNTDEMAILENLTSEDLTTLSEAYLLIDRVTDKLDLRNNSLSSASNRLQLNFDEVCGAVGDEKIEILRQLADFVDRQIYYDSMLGKYSMYLIDYVEDFNHARRYNDMDKIPDIGCFFNIVYVFKLFEEAAEQTASALMSNPLLFPKFLTLKMELRHLVMAKMTRQIFYKESEDAEFLAEGFLVSMEAGGLGSEVSVLLEDFHPQVESLVVLERLLGLPNIRARTDLQKIRSIWEQKYKKEIQENEKLDDSNKSDQDG